MLVPPNITEFKGPFRTPAALSLSPGRPAQFLYMLQGQMSLGKDFISKILLLNTHTNARTRTHTEIKVFSSQITWKSLGLKGWGTTCSSELSTFSASLYIISEVSTTRQLQGKTQTIIVDSEHSFFLLTFFFNECIVFQHPENKMQHFYTHCKALSKNSTGGWTESTLNLTISFLASWFVLPAITLLFFYRLGAYVNITSLAPGTELMHLNSSQSKHWPTFCPKNHTSRLLYIPFRGSFVPYLGVKMSLYCSFSTLATDMGMTMSLTLYSLTPCRLRRNPLKETGSKLNKEQHTHVHTFKVVQHQGFLETFQIFHI